MAGWELSVRIADLGITRNHLEYYYRNGIHDFELHKKKNDTTSLSVPNTDKCFPICYTQK